MKKTIKALAVLLSLCLLFSACGGSSDYAMSAPRESPSASYAPARAQSYAAEMGMANTKLADMDLGSTTGSTAAVSDRKLVKTIDLSMETMEFEKAVEEILRLISSSGGYVENQSINGVSLTSGGGYNERRANINARVPAGALDGVAGEIAALCNVTSRQENVSDITENYYDTESRLKSLRVQEEQLLEMLGMATRVEDLITIRDSLADVQYRIDSLTSQLSRMDKQVSYSYLNLNLREVSRYRIADSLPKSFFDRLQNAFVNGVEAVGDTLEDVLFFLIEDLPSLLIYIGCFLLVLWVVMKLYGRLAPAAWKARWRSRKQRKQDAAGYATPAPAAKAESEREEPKQ